MATLMLATGNPGKIRELRAFLKDWEVLGKPPDLEIEETGTTFSANARLKALGIAQATGQVALGDDSGLEVLALKGRPGVYSARWGASDPERIQRLLTELGDQPDRRARFVACMVLADPSGIIAEVEGVMDGEILRAPQGSGGFGYDPVFYYPPFGVTLAQMTLDQKQSVSHRGQALRLLYPTLEKWR